MDNLHAQEVDKLHAQEVDKLHAQEVDNLHAQVGDKFTRQTVGVSMGTSCSPWLVDLTLLMHELEHVSFEFLQLKPWDINSKSATQQHLLV